MATILTIIVAEMKNHETLTQILLQHLLVTSEYEKNIVMMNLWIHIISFTYNMFWRFCFDGETYSLRQRL